jgi:GNAT superfamily N-acetyltransferase
MEPTFQDIQKGEEEDVSQLVEEVFDSLVAPDLVAEGVEEFKRHITPEVLRGKVADENTFILTAKDGRDIVGVIAIKENRHIFLFFVREDLQGMGIAKELFSLALWRCRRDNPGLAGITVNSSPYAVPIYKRLGFVPTEPEKVINGVRHTPMLYKI